MWTYEDKLTVYLYMKEKPATKLIRSAPEEPETI